MALYTMQETRKLLNVTRMTLLAWEQKYIGRDKIEYPDRLARFGYQYIQMLCNQGGVEIETINKTETREPDKEMVEDLIAIITSFSARLYGARGGKKIK